MKRKPADAAFSLCVRESQDWTCERCGTQYDEKSMGLHCSHVFSRRHRNIRFCRDNAQSLCFHCHSWYGGNPADSGRWIESELGEGAIAILREKRDSGVKVSKLEEKDIAKHYRKEYQAMKDRRANGETGVLDFESWQ